MIPTPYPPRLQFPKSRKSVQRNARALRGGPPGGQWVRHPIFFGGLVFIHMLRNIYQPVGPHGRRYHSGYYQVRRGSFLKFVPMDPFGTIPSPPWRAWPIWLLFSVKMTQPHPLLPINPPRFARDFRCVPCHLPDSPAPLYCHSSRPCRPLGAPRSPLHGGA